MGPDVKSQPGTQMRAREPREPESQRVREPREPNQGEEDPPSHLLRRRPLQSTGTRRPPHTAASSSAAEASNAKAAHPASATRAQCLKPRCRRWSSRPPPASPQASPAPSRMPLQLSRRATSRQDQSSLQLDPAPPV